MALTLFLVIYKLSFESPWKFVKTDLALLYQLQAGEMKEMFVCEAINKLKLNIRKNKRRSLDNGILRAAKCVVCICLLFAQV